MTDMHLVDPMPASDQPEVLLAGWPVSAEEALLGELRARGVPARTVSLESLATRKEPAVVALGPEADAETLRGTSDTWVVLAFGANVDQGLFFTTSKLPSPRDTVDLLHAAWKHATRAPRDGDADAERKGRVLDLLRRVGRAADLPAAARDIERELGVVANVDQARVSSECPNAGVTGFVARTGRGVAVERLEDDPRYDAEIDGPDPRARFLAVPVALDEEVLAVLALTRAPQRPAFREQEQKFANWTARLLAPVLARLLLDVELEARAAKRHAAIRPDVAQLFRGEALEQYQRGRADEAHPLEIEPRWTRHAYRVLLALFVAAVIFALVVPVDRNATGVAVVRGGRLQGFVETGPEVQPGMPLWFEHASGATTVAGVGQEIVAAAEARRVAGAGWPDDEPAVRIEAALPPGGKRFGNGVTGKIRIRTGRERLFSALLRGLT